MTPSEVRKELVFIVTGLMALGLSLTALASQVTIVAQKDRKFSTDVVNIAVGDTIRFTNEDPFLHQLYTKSPTFNFSSEQQPRGMILPVPFTVAGTFEVRCQIHPKMLLIVNVK
jgi:plastocyanin